MSFDNNSFYDDNSTKNWQPQPTPMEDRRRRHTGRWITAIVILALLVLTGVGTVHLVRDVGVTLNRSDSGFLLTIGREQPAESADVQPAAQEQAAAAEGPAPAAQTPVQAQAQAELPQLEISSSPAGVPTSASEDAGALSLQEIYRRCSGSVVSIISVTQSGKASGTGIIMSADGYIITNHHVIENAQAVSVLTNSDKEYAAVIIGSDETSDLAVLKIEASGLQAAEFGDSSVLQVGDSVVAIGNPLGELTFSLTTGVVSALDRPVTFSTGSTMNLIQTDCAINSGNSGGALFNLYGEVIGITNAKYSSSSASSEASIDNIGFAIPIDQVRSIFESIITNGYIVKPYIGVTVSDVSTESQSYGLPQGAAVRSVTENGPAAEAGLQENDIITTVNGEAITGSNDLVKLVKAASAGDTLELTVYRQGQTVTLTLTVGEQKTDALPTQTADETQQPQSQNPYDGQYGGQSNGQSGDSFGSWPFGFGFGG